MTLRLSRRLEVRDGAAAAVTGIRRLSELTGVTPRALRYYEAQGLLRPHRTAAGARIFTAHQCDLASMIVLLRKLDVPVATIARLLKGPGSEADRLSDLRRAVEDKMVELARRLNEVRRTLDAGLPHESESQNNPSSDTSMDLPGAVSRQA